jgi:anti-sigma factor RsiW
MTSPHPQHLTWDDLDDLLMGTERSSVHVHLETCAECRKLAAADLSLVVQIQRLPQYAPRPGFADRVMAGLEPKAVTLAAPLPRRPAAFLKAAAVALALGSLGTSVGWSLANQSLLQALRGEALGAMQDTAARMLQLAGSIPQSALVAALRDTLGGVGVGLLLTAAASVYLAGLLSLRRLVAVPERAP